jgi:hypothetical protein
MIFILLAITSLNISALTAHAQEANAIQCTLNEQRAEKQNRSERVMDLESLRSDTDTRVLLLHGKVQTFLDVSRRSPGQSVKIESATITYHAEEATFTTSAKIDDQNRLRANLEVFSKKNGSSESELYWVGLNCSLTN